MAKKGMIILSILIFSGLIVFIVNVSNEFYYTQDIVERNFIFPALEIEMVRDVGSDAYYIAGSTSSGIFLGNSLSPLQLLFVPYVESCSMEMRTIAYSRPEILKSTQITVDSPAFYIADFLALILLQGQLDRLEAEPFLYDSVFFTEAVPFSSSSVAIRTIDPLLKEFVLAKETSYFPYVARFPSLLEKQIDGLFCTDGMLHYNSSLKHLIYVYFYRNEFICMDTSMNLLYRGTTIDTTSRARIRVAELSAEKIRTQATPPHIVNRTSCVGGTRLFVHSNMMSKNDNRDDFIRSSVIDAYTLDDGRYDFSFYIPDYKGKRMKSFRVFKDRIVVINDHYVLKYKFPPI